MYTCGLSKGGTMQVMQATGQPFENEIYLEFVSEIFTWIVCWKHLILIKRGWGRKYIFVKIQKSKELRLLIFARLFSNLFPFFKLVVIETKDISHFGPVMCCALQSKTNWSKTSVLLCSLLLQEKYVLSYCSFGVFSPSFLFIHPISEFSWNFF